MAADFYGLLGVSRDATPEEIKKAYRRKAREHHPDANHGDPEAEARFKELSVAYEVLSDPDKRQQYDLYGEAGFGQGGAGDPFGGADFGDIFEQFFGGGGSPFGGGAARRGPDRTAPGRRPRAVRRDRLPRGRLRRPEGRHRAHGRGLRGV